LNLALWCAFSSMWCAIRFPVAFGVGVFSWFFSSEQGTQAFSFFHSAPRSGVFCSCYSSCCVGVCPAPIPRALDFVFLFPESARVVNFTRSVACFKQLGISLLPCLSAGSACTEGNGLMRSLARGVLIWVLMVMICFQLAPRECLWLSATRSSFPCPDPPAPTQICWPAAVSRSGLSVPVSCNRGTIRTALLLALRICSLVQIRFFNWRESGDRSRFFCSSSVVIFLSYLWFSSLDLCCPKTVRDSSGALGAWFVFLITKSSHWLCSFRCSLLVFSRRQCARSAHPGSFSRCSVLVYRLLSFPMVCCDWILAGGFPVLFLSYRIK
jgi:hypothetical protein